MCVYIVYMYVYIYGFVDKLKYPALVGIQWKYYLTIWVRPDTPPKKQHQRKNKHGPKFLSYEKSGPLYLKVSGKIHICQIVFVGDLDFPWLNFKISCPTV